MLRKMSRKLSILKTVKGSLFFQFWRDIVNVYG